MVAPKSPDRRRSGIWVILDPDVKTWLLENVPDGERSRWIEDAIKMKRISPRLS